MTNNIALNTQAITEEKFILLTNLSDNRPNVEQTKINT